jgi:septation ring formation regulator EzrA
MTFRTRYRVLFNGEQYKVQYQVFRLTLFGRHWKRKWVDLESTSFLSFTEAFFTVELYGTRLFNSLDDAKLRCEIINNNMKLERSIQKRMRRTELALKKNIWEKVWP